MSCPMRRPHRLALQELGVSEAPQEIHSAPGEMPSVPLSVLPSCHHPPPRVLRASWTKGAERWAGWAPLRRCEHPLGGSVLGG